MSKGIPEQIEFRANGDANSYAMINPETNTWWMAILCNGEHPLAYQVESLRRLAACWNACAGFTTEELEVHTGPRLLHTRLEESFSRIDTLLGERNATGLAIDAAIRAGVVPEQHPLRSRLEMLANHRQREQDLLAEVERLTNQINELPGLDTFGEIDRLKQELSLMAHKILTCGVAARHPDAALSSRESDYGGKWNSPQAEAVRAIRQQHDQLLAALVYADRMLTNLQPHIPQACYPNKAAFIDNYVDPALEQIRAAIANVRPE